MCVQYMGEGVFSTSGVIMSTSGVFGTSEGYHDACGGYHEYIGGIFQESLQSSPSFWAITLQAECFKQKTASNKIIDINNKVTKSSMRSSDKEIRHSENKNVM